MSPDIAGQIIVGVIMFCIIPGPMILVWMQMAWLTRNPPIRHGLYGEDGHVLRCLSVERRWGFSPGFRADMVIEDHKDPNMIGHEFVFTGVDVWLRGVTVHRMPYTPPELQPILKRAR